MAELTARRTANAKVFDLGGGIRRHDFHTGLIHYQDSGRAWQEIDTTLVAKAGGWYQDKCAYSAELPTLATGVFTYHHIDHDFTVSFPGASPVSPEPVKHRRGELGKAFRYTDAFGAGCHLEVWCTNRGMKKVIVLDKPPTDVSNPIKFPFLILSAPTDIVKTDVSGLSAVAVDTSKTEAQAVKCTDEIIRLQGVSAVSYIWKARAWDSADERRSWPIEVYFYESGGKRYFVKILSPAILKAATYPLYFDDPTDYAPPAGDGNVEMSGYSTWDTTHDAVTGAYVSYTDGDNGIVARTGKDASANYLITRGFVPFTTTGLSGTLTAANLALYVSGIIDTDDGDLCIVGPTTQASVTTLSTADFDQCAAIDSPTEIASRVDFGSITATQVNNFTITSLGASPTWIVGNYAMIGLREENDVIDSAYAGANNTHNRLRADASENADAGQDPVLGITVAAGASAVPVFMHHYTQQRKK